jgi:hypothetical protein
VFGTDGSVISASTVGVMAFERVLVGNDGSPAAMSAVRTHLAVATGVRAAALLGRGNPRPRCANRATEDGLSADGRQRVDWNARVY